MSTKIDYKKVQAGLQDFLSQYSKVAEEETTVADPTIQAAAGTETQKEIAANVPEGHSVQDAIENDGSSKEEPKVETAPIPKVETDDPSKDNEANGSEAAIKKAHAQQYLLGTAVLKTIDTFFNNAATKEAAVEEVAAPSEFAQKVASVMAAKQADNTQLEEIVKTAESYKVAHVNNLVETLGVDIKVANEIMNQVAETNPEAILPPETMSPEEAEAIMAEASADIEGDPAAEESANAAMADAEGVLAPEEGVEEAPMEEGVDADAMAAELEPVVAQLKEEGFEDEEIMNALMEEAGISDEDVVEFMAESLTEQGLAPEEAEGLIGELQELAAAGVKPEELAQMIEESSGEEGAEEAPIEEAPIEEAPIEEAPVEELPQV